MSNTTENMINAAKAIAAEITNKGKELGVDVCYIDDWGRYGNFAMLCYLDLDSRNKPIRQASFKMIKVVNLIKKIVREHKDKGAIFRSHESPLGIYKSNSVHGMRLASDFEGYDKKYIYVDLDFIPYNKNSNTFAVQTEQTEPVINNSAQLELFSND